MQTIRQRRTIRAFSANDPKVERATYHRNPEWFEGHQRSLGDRAVGIVLAICGASIIVVLLSERYGAGVL